MYVSNFKLTKLSLTPSLCVSLLLCSNAFAFPDRVSQVPNNQWNCSLCHVSPSGGGERTSFGEETKNTPSVAGKVDWTTICEVDSDGDSFTNGEELGDPNCSWVFGDPNPAGEITNPADAESMPSEQMMAEAGEMMAEAGEMMAEAGEIIAEAGEMMAEAGEMIEEEGETSETGGCDSQVSRTPWSFGLSLLMLLGLVRLSRRYS